MMLVANQDRNHLTSDSCLSGREGLLPRNNRGGGRAAQARGPGQKEDDNRILVAHPVSLSRPRMPEALSITPRLTCNFYPATCETQPA